ncbi:MAG: hypothetical protein OEM07_06565 [Gammaproteobacteria bacterium]|nr:hypothetical protein [Gammaproteobacteria bacterium]
MRSFATKILIIIALLTSTTLKADSGAFILGLNLDFIQSREYGSGFDGGFGFHAGYEFLESENWYYGGLVEVLNGWNDTEDLYTEGDMMYNSKSLLAIARPKEWPVMFKAGIVDAEYQVVKEMLGIPLLSRVNDTGYTYGLALAIGDEKFRLNLLDYKRIKIGDDNFSAFSISLLILFHG